MKIFICLVAVVIFLSCNTDTKPYIKHSLAKQEKLSAGCDGGNTSFNMEANIIGERYTFEKCLPASFDGKYTLERKGDSIRVNFAKADGPKALYKLVMDIDTYPSYHFITIDGTTFSVITSAN